MSLKTQLIRFFSSFVARQVKAMAKNAITDQDKIFKNLLKKGQSTAFGKDHGFSKIQNYEDFKNHVQVRDYEDLKLYFDRVAGGEFDVLWPGKPKYLAKTSGTTSGIKYIPITNDSMPNHIGSARAALLNYIHQTGNCAVFKGKLIFLSGSPELGSKGGIATGRLSGIVNHEIPSWVKTNQLPSYETNCIEDWEEKLDAIIKETEYQDMRLISGIPPWVQMYYERILEKNGCKTMMELFPNFSLFMYGGVNFEPYRSQLEKLVGKKIDSIETFPASEGFIAFQDDQKSQSLLLNTNSGIFYEFIPIKEVGVTNPKRLKLQEVKLEEDYALVLSSNAGLWAYSIGDTIRFTSLQPYKLIVSGRVKHFISAFGEHVIAKEVEEAMSAAYEKYKFNINEFTVAPQVAPRDGGLPYHEWLIEFGDKIIDVDALAQDLDEAMIKQNIYYEDLRTGNILRRLQVVALRKDSFRDYMKNIGKLGGQNKVPRLSNDRQIADKLILLQQF